MRFAYTFALASLVTLLPALAAPAEASKRDDPNVVLEVDGYQTVQSVDNTWGGVGGNVWQFDMTVENWLQTFVATMYPEPAAGNEDNWKSAKPTATLQCQIQAIPPPTETVSLTLAFQPPYVATPTVGGVDLKCSQL